MEKTENGSSIDLEPSLMTIYDNYIQDSVNNDVENNQSLPSSPPSSLGSREASQRHNHNHNHVTFDESTHHPSVDMNTATTEVVPPGGYCDAKKRPLSISSTSSSTSSTSSLPRHQHKKVAAMVAYHGNGSTNMGMDSPLDVLTDEELDVIEPIPECSDSDHMTSEGERTPCNSREVTPQKKCTGVVTPLQRTSLEQSSLGLSYIDKVVAEILATERTYVRDLDEIIHGYMRPLSLNLDHGLQSSDVEALFGNIEDICSFNSDFLENLEKCESDPVQVAQCFVDNKEGFVIYTDYCTNYPRSVEVLTCVMREESTSEVFRGQQMKLGHSLPLGAYLLKPVQRVLKYHLLLQNILGSFDQDQSGYTVIETALASMTRVAQHINEMKRRHEHAVRIQEIQSLLVDWDGADLTTYGELVLEESFKMSRAKTSRQLFLFDKALLIAKKKEEGGLMIKSAIMCSNLMLIESIPGDPLSFHLIPFDNPRMQHTVHCRSLEQKRRWCLEVKRVILDNYETVIPDKAKQLVYMLGRSREEQDLDDSGHVVPETSSKKQHSAPEYLERRRTRRKSTTILPDFGLLKGQKGKKGARKSPPMRRKSDVGCGVESTVLKNLTEPVDTTEACPRLSGSSATSSLSERPRSRSLESIDGILDDDAPDNPDCDDTRLQDFDDSFSYCSNSLLRKPTSFRIATELNRVDSITVEKQRQRKNKVPRKGADAKRTVDNQEQEDPKDDGYVDVVFTEQGFQVVTPPEQPAYSNVHIPSCPRLDTVAMDDSEGDYIELPSVQRSPSPCVHENIPNNFHQTNLSDSPISVLTDCKKSGNHLQLPPPDILVSHSHTSTPVASDCSRSRRFLSDPGTNLATQLGGLLDSLGAKLSDSRSFLPLQRTSDEDRNGQAYSLGASTFYLRSPLSSPNRSRSELAADDSNDNNKSGRRSSLEDPWIPRSVTTTRKAATLSGYGAGSLSGARKQCPLRRSSSFTMGDSQEDLRPSCSGHRRQPSDTLVFMNRCAFLASHKKIVPDMDTEKILARLGTPPREQRPKNMCEKIEQSKEHGKIVARYGTPPRTVIASNSEETSASDNSSSLSGQNEVQDPSFTCLPSVDQYTDSPSSSVLWSDTENPSPSAYSVTPKSPLGIRRGFHANNRPDSVCSTSSAPSNIVHSVSMTSPESSVLTTPNTTPSSPFSPDNMIDSLKQAVQNLTAKITRRGPRSLDTSPCRTPSRESSEVHHTQFRTHSASFSGVRLNSTGIPHAQFRTHSASFSGGRANLVTDRSRSDSKDSALRKDKRRHFVYQLARAYSNRIKRANIVQRTGRETTTAKQLVSLLKENKPGSPSIGARMASSRPIVLGTYTLPHRRSYKSRFGKDKSEIRSSPQRSEPSWLTEELCITEPTDVKVTELGDSAKNKVLPPDNLILSKKCTSSKENEDSSTDSEESSSLYYYENKFAADLEAGLEDEAFRDSAVYSDDEKTPAVAEDYPGMQVSIRDTVRLIEQRYRGKPIPKIEVKQKEKASGIQDILKSLEISQGNGGDQPGAEHNDKSGLKSVRDRTRELMECATLTRIRQTSLSISGSDEGHNQDDSEMSFSDPDCLAALKKGPQKGEMGAESRA